jgi:hypothetical protein
MKFSNNDIFLLNYLFCKKRVDCDILFEIIINNNKQSIDLLKITDYFYINKKFNNYDKLIIKKKYNNLLIYIFKDEYIEIFLWQLSIISNFFYNNNIESSFYNITKYNQYLNKGGYEIDKKIYFENNNDDYLKKDILIKKFING